MSTEKLSELSKPAWIVGQQEIADFMRGDEALLVRGYDPESTEPALRMYSQEYVSALLAELEAKDKRIAELSRLLAHNIERSEEAEKRLATPVRLPEPCVYEVNGTMFYDRLSEAEVIASLREQGFTVEGG